MKISRDPFAKRGLKLVINTIFPRSKILSPSYPPLLLPHLSLSLPFSLHIPPSRSPARSFALVPSHFPAFSLSSMTSFSRSHRLAYTQLFLSHHTSENPVSKRENGWTTCTRFKTNTTNLRVTLAGRYYVLFQLPPPPSLVHLPYVELSVPWRRKRRILPAVKQLSHIRTDFLYRNVKRIDKRIFYCRRLFLHFHFSLELAVVNRIDHNYI